jgi:hypothetical protein
VPICEISGKHIMLISPQTKKALEKLQELFLNQKPTAKG